MTTNMCAWLARVAPAPGGLQHPFEVRSRDQILDDIIVLDGRPQRRASLRPKRRRSLPVDIGEAVFMCQLRGDEGATGPLHDIRILGKGCDHPAWKLDGHSG